MLAVQKNEPVVVESKKTKKIRTTLYDLIAAVEEQLQPGEDELAGKVVLQILHKYGPRFDGDLFKGALALK